LVDVDALDAAAALASVVERAVDQIGDGVIELHVRQNVGRVLAAELKAQRHEGARGSLLDGAAAGDRSGEVAMVDLAGTEQLLRLRMAEHDVLEHASGQACL